MYWFWKQKCSATLFICDNKVLLWWSYAFSNSIFNPVSTFISTKKTPPRYISILAKIQNTNPSNYFPLRLKLLFCFWLSNENKQPKISSFYQQIIQTKYKKQEEEKKFRTFSDTFFFFLNSLVLSRSAYIIIVIQLLSFVMVRLPPQ